MRCRPIYLSVGLVLALASAPVLQAKPFARSAEPVKQIALSEDKVTQYLAAAPALDAILAKVPAGPGAAPEPRLMASLNATARDFGFADYASYESIAVNIVWILTGIDPLSKNISVFRRSRAPKSPRFWRARTCRPRTRSGSSRPTTRKC